MSVKLMLLENMNIKYEIYIYYIYVYIKYKYIVYIIINIYINIKYEKNVLDKKITCASSWIIMLQSLDGSHIMIINGIIIIHLSKWIEFNFNWILNTRNFLLFF